MKDKQKLQNVSDIESKSLEIENTLFKTAYFQLTETLSKLKETEYFFEESQRAAFIGSYKFDIAKDSWISSDVLDEIFGIGKDYKRTMQGWFDLIHKDDLEMVSEYIPKLAKTRDPRFEKDYRIIKKNTNEIKWIRGVGTIIYGDDGSPVMMTGTIQDVSIYKINQENEKRLNEELKNAQTMAKIGSFKLDLKTGKAILSEELLLMYGLDTKKNEITHKDFLSIISTKDRDRVDKEINNSIKNKETNSITEYDIVLSDNSRRYMKAYAEILYNGDKPTTFFGVAQDITEQKELDEAKSGFLSIISHQLNTPLSMSKWLIEILKEGENLTPEQIEKINDLNISNERLIDLAKRLMKVVLIESGKIEVNKKSISIIDIVNNVIKETSLLAKKKNKEVRITHSVESNEINSDPLLIHEALENLLVNAILYATEDSRYIDVSITDEGGYYIISIHNHGYIEKTLQNKMRKFDRFYHEGSPTEQGSHGSGLGLFIAKKVVEVNGGSFGFESNIESGTKFYFTVNKL